MMRVVRLVHSLRVFHHSTFAIIAEVFLYLLFESRCHNPSLNSAVMEFDE